MSFQVYFTLGKTEGKRKAFFLQSASRGGGGGKGGFCEITSGALVCNKR